MPRELREDKPFPQMCAQCREPLTPIGPRVIGDDQNPDNYRWVHGRRDSDEDHEPQRIPLVNDADARLICDFCGVHHPTWDFPCKTFVDTWTGIRSGVYGKTEGFDSGGDWTACDSCMQLIVADDYKALSKRALKQFGDGTPAEKSAMYARLSTMHRQFRDNRTGPPVPISNTHWIAAELSTIFQSGD